ncbi:MAG: helix-turn-helix domain-containing protein [Gammaproteobacteria bacterium]|nr:helix-turn-helix domain-containing protein [Gammaproteobacteria bacterium]
MPKQREMGFTSLENSLTFSATLHQAHTMTLKITLLILPESSMMSVASALDPMRAANRLNNQRLFDWEVVTLTNEPMMLSCGISIAPDTSIESLLADKDHKTKDNKKELLIIISSFNQNRYVSKSQLNLIRSLSRRHSAICAVESAAWIIARCGLLHRKAATTHWEDLEDFALAFPEIEVKCDRIVTDGTISTTGGASPTFDFMLHFIESHFSQALAIEVSSIFIYQGYQPDDFQQCTSLGALKNKEPRIARAINIMEENIEAPLSIQKIAHRINLSTRQMENLFSQSLSDSPGAYYRHLRLQTARRFVIDTNLDMYEIMLRTGFASLSAFSRAFKQHFSCSPLQLRQTHKQALSVPKKRPRKPFGHQLEEQPKIAGLTQTNENLVAPSTAV